MKKIELVKGTIYALVDDEDFKYITQWKWYNAKGYAVRSDVFDDLRVNVYMHRVLTNCPDDKYVDHIDGNGLNNQKSNLRICTNKQNTRNSRKRTTNKSGYKGVCWNPRLEKWVAQITANGKKHHIGVYLTKIDAAKAYDIEAIKYFEEYAFLNFPNKENK